MEPRYIASRVARNSAISTRYLAAFTAICLVSTIVLSIGSLMLGVLSDDAITRVRLGSGGISPDMQTYLSGGILGRGVT